MIIDHHVRKAALIRLALSLSPANYPGLQVTFPCRRRCHWLALLLVIWQVGNANVRGAKACRKNPGGEITGQNGTYKRKPLRRLGLGLGLGLGLWSCFMKNDGDLCIQTNLGGLSWVRAVDGVERSCSENPFKKALSRLGKSPCQ